MRYSVAPSSCAVRYHRCGGQISHASADLGWIDAMSSHIELAGVPESCAIRSGHYMMSNLDDRSSSDEDDLPQSIVETQHTAPKIPSWWKKASGKANGKARPSPYLFTGGKKKRAVITEMDISDLAKLFDSLSVYSDQLTTPRWNNFRCLRLSRTDRIRLNNLIWREFYTQHIKHLKAKFVKFETPSLENHQRPRAVILEGKYWKRRRDFVCVEYLRWRCYYKLRLNGKGYPMEVSDSELLEKVAGDPQQNVLGFSVDEAMDTEDLLSDLVSNLEWLLDAPAATSSFSMLSGPGAMANSPPDVGGNSNADMMQPLLLQMTPNLEEHNDLLHNILVSPTASPLPSPHLLPEHPSEQTPLMPPPSHPLLLQPAPVVSQALPSSVVVTLPQFSPCSSRMPSGPVPTRTGTQPCRKEPYTKRRRRSGHSSPAPRLLAIAPKPVPSGVALLPSRTSPLAEMASPLPSSHPPTLDCQRLLSDINRSLSLNRHRRPATPPDPQPASQPASHLESLHDSPEYRCRGGINQALVRLHALLPEAVCRGPGAKQIPMSKAMILHRSADQIRDLRRQHTENERRAHALRQEVERLQTEIDGCCSKLPETGLPMPHTNNKGQQWFRAYIRASTLRNSKFYVFSLIAEKLFAAYTSLVSMNSLQDFTVSLMTWLEQYCSMNSLRNHVRGAMTALCTKTSILTDPSRLADESVALVNEAEVRPS